MKILNVFRTEYDAILYATSSYFCNEIINSIPSHKLRLFFYRRIFNISIGEHTSIGMHTEFIHPKGVSIGDHCAIGQWTYLDGRGNLAIGSNVNISSRVSIHTSSHNHKSPNWEYTREKTVIDDDVWIASNATIIQGIHIERGAVVAAGSVVVRDVMPFEIVGGNPAKRIGERNKNIHYLTNYFPLFI